ncbi:hypothetical protein [Halobacterium wangiae]|uniref:hypothetical protein n=1 Tax=Halobacterium wangiae TaxID=2902623 RepID=UPI001E5A227F|nr:hypothetical protein [Halobacterium wangiae]
MPQESFGDYTIRKRAAGESGLTEGEEDISDGIDVEVGDVSAFTLYLGVSTATAVDVQVFLSPDGGTNWYEPDESPVSLPSDDESAVEHIPYNASAVRLVESSGTPVKAQIREVV